MIDAELRALLVDCLHLWGVEGSTRVDESGIHIVVADGVYTLHRAEPEYRPVRWLLQTPERRAANRPPRAAPSIVALLTALRNALGAESGNKLRIGTRGSPATRAEHYAGSTILDTPGPPL